MFLAKAGFIALAAQVPVKLRATESGQGAAASSAGQTADTNHLETWRRFMSRYRLMC
jgi:hypothetical protein